MVVERPRRVVLTWGWVDPGMGVPPGSSRVEIALRPAPEDPRATVLRLTHSGLAPDARPLHDDAWTRFLARLAAVSKGATRAVSDRATRGAPALAVAS